VPAMALGFIGQFWPGAKYMMASLGLLLAWNLYSGRHHEAVALVLGCIPVLSFFRGFFFYYAIMVFLGAAIAFWLVKNTAIVTTIWRDIAWRYFICAGLVYWWITYLITGDYTENIR